MPTSTGTYDTSTITYDQSSLSYDGFPAPLSGMPAVGVFVAWTGTPYEVNPTGGWTEISQYVRQVTIRRGRQDDLQQFPPGTAQLVLDNRDRLFDPFNTASPNFANLKPRKAVKIVANWNGTEYPLYRGYVAGWPVEYTEAGLDSTVTIDCFDVLGLLGSATFDADRYRQSVLALSPVNYWTFNELSSTQSTNPTIGDSGSRNPVTLPTNLLEQSIGSQVARGVTSPFFNPDSYLSASGGYGSSSTGESTDFAISFWAKTYQGRIGYGTTFEIYTWNPTTLYSFSFGLNYSPAQATQFGMGIRLGGAGSDTNRIFTDNQPHHVVINYQRSVGQVRIFVDGVDQTVVKTTVTNVSAPFPIAFFNWRYTIIYPGGSGRSPDYGQVGISQMAFFDKVLTATQIQDLYDAGFGFKNETSSARINRYVSEFGLPSGLFNVSSTPAANVGDFVTNNQALLSEFQKVTLTEGGELFVDDQGVVQFYDRDAYWRGRSATSQVTFTDTGVGVEYDASAVRLTLDADRARNEIALNTADGFNAQFQDATSVATYGLAGESRQTSYVSNAAAQTYAERFVTIFKNPMMTVEPFMVKGQADPSYNWPRLLGLELLDKITFKRTPATGSAIEKDLLVQSIEHRITPGEWQTVVNGSARYTNWFIVGVSLIGGDDLLLN